MVPVAQSQTFRPSRRSGAALVRSVMYGLMGVTVGLLAFDTWKAESALGRRALDAQALKLAAVQRMHSQRLARLAMQVVALPGDASRVSSELAASLEEGDADAVALERMLTLRNEADRLPAAAADALTKWQLKRAALWLRGQALLAVLSGSGLSAPVLAETARQVDSAADPALGTAQVLLDAIDEAVNARYAQESQSALRRAAVATVGLLLLGVFAVEPAARAIRRQQARLESQAQRLQTLAAVARLTGSAVWIVDARSQVTWVNDAFICLTGYDRHEINADQRARDSLLRLAGERSPSSDAVVGRDIKGEGRAQVEFVAKDGTVRWLDVDMKRWQPEGRGGFGYVSVAHDITERKKSEALIEHLALHDALTDLPNSRLLRDRLCQALLASARERTIAAVLVIDLDNFKEVNDTRGHGVGDQLLVEAAQRLRAGVRAHDTVARLGGDEFVVILDGLGSAGDAAQAQAVSHGERLRAALSRPYSLTDGSTLHGSASIGIRLLDPVTDTIDDVLKHADAAMYQAKREGRDAVRLFDPSVYDAMRVRVELEADLRNAVGTAQLDLHYQPQVNDAGVVVGAEALMRWRHPQRGAIAPGQFIPVAEESGLILALGQFVLERAARQLAAWKVSLLTEDLILAINVSARQFAQPDFVESVIRALRTHDAPPKRLEIELTEGLVLKNIGDAAAKMAALKSLGVRFAMDDFGTQHASLSYLAQLPLDTIKIDQSFVRTVDRDPRQAAVVRAIIEMARGLHLDVVAEGVETQEQRDLLAANGCRRYQGYFFGKPARPVEFEAILSAGGRVPT
jgi:diguanylate cyclase (GGDEF)-like protein/PAS domain S-box-containing protein